MPTKLFKRFLLVIVLLLAIPAAIGVTALYRAVRSPLLTEVARRLEDLAYLETVLREEHVDLARYIAPERFRQQVGRVRRAIRESEPGELGPHLLLTRYLEVVAAVGDPHTAVNNIQEVMGVYPFYAYMFDEGAYVIAARTRDAPLLGGRLLAIDETPIESALELLESVVPHSNDSGFMAALPAYLRLPGLLYGLGIALSPETVHLTVETAEGHNAVVRLEALSAGAFRSLDDYTRLKSDVPEDELPLYVRQRESNYWYTYLEDQKLLYVRFRLAADDRDETGEAFWERMLSFTDTVPVDRFVVDLRGNTGGDNFFHMPLIAGIRARPHLNARGTLFTVVDRGTFSAAISCAGAMERHTETLFVGEKFGDRPHTGGDPRYYTLPHSRIQLGISKLIWINTHEADSRDAIEPDLLVTKNFDDYIAGRDPALKRIAQYGRSGAEEGTNASSEENSEMASSLDSGAGGDDSFSAYSFMKTEDYDSALSRLTRMREGEPERLILRRNNLNMLAWEIAYLTGDRDRALEVIRLNAALNPDDPFVYIRQAQMNGMNGNRLRSAWLFSRAALTCVKRYFQIRNMNDHYLPL